MSEAYDCNVAQLMIVDGIDGNANGGRAIVLRAPGGSVAQADVGTVFFCWAK